jgi:hypothetical protein
MKKFWLFLPVILLAMGGLLMIGCASDPDEGKKVEPDFVLKGGKYQFTFDEPKIVDGEEYEVIFTINDCDDAFIGSYLGGKICYKMDMDDNDEKVLSGWLNSTPNKVSKSIKTYKWTFTAGDQHDDDVTVESPATTPDGGKQYFSLTAQDSSWNDYPASASFGVKGSFSVKLKGAVDWESAGEVTLGNAEGIVGKGELSAEDMAKIRALPAGSIIRLTVTVTPVAGESEPTWGVGSIGTWVAEDSMSIAVPSNAVIGTPITFTADFDIDTLLGIVGADNIAINVWSGAQVTKAELFTSSGGPIVFVSAGLVTLGDADGAGDGKGEFSAADMTKIRALPARSKIVFTVDITPVADVSGPGYGICGIADSDWDTKVEIRVPNNAAIGTPITFTAEFEIATLLEMVGSSNIVLNVYNGAKITKAELFRPGP